MRPYSGLDAWAGRWLDEHPAAERQERGAEIVNGRFSFLRQWRTFPHGVDWRGEAPRLWRFHLQYHEFLLDVYASVQQESLERAAVRVWTYVLDWIRTFPHRQRYREPDAWHPYCISRRLPVWFALWQLLPPLEVDRERILTSAADQTRFLARNLEWDVRGNHLLENIKALALAGTFFTGREAKRWGEQAAALFESQCREQILLHGEHFERSPMYHALMLRAILDVHDTATSVQPRLAEASARAARKMGRFLQAILHPDGAIPLLGDSAIDELANLPGLLRSAAGVRPEEPGVTSGLRGETRRGGLRHAMPKRPVDGSQCIGDYWVWRDGGDFLLFDRGPLAADELPAHAHADLSNFELSLRGRRLLVDSGNFDYEAGPMRDYCRATRAHNVVEIDGLDQADMWSRFRIGYRGRPIGYRQGRRGPVDWAAMWHNAYRRAGVPRVGRWLACRPGGPWNCVDWAEGSGAHRLVGRLHVAPGIRVQCDGPRRVTLFTPEAAAHLVFSEQVSVQLDSGWYCPRFGERVATTVIRYAYVGELPVGVGWTLGWTAEIRAPWWELGAKGRVEVVMGEVEGEQRIVVTP